MSYKLIIAGSRGLDVSHSDIVRALAEADWGWPDVVVSGLARGPDIAGLRWADFAGIKVQPMPADWGKHGKRAGVTRNIEMANAADRLLAFWDGASRGTKHMIEAMRARKKPTHVVTP